MKKVIFMLNICILFLFSSAYAQQTDTTSSKPMDPKAAQYYNRGVEEMKAGNFPGAVVSFDSSLQVQKDFRTYLLKGQALMKQGNLQDAKAAFLSSFAEDSTNDQTAYALGNVNLALKVYPEAIYYYEKAANITKNPTIKSDAESSIKLAQQNTAIEFYNKGNELQKENKFDEAIQNYDRSLQITSDYRTYYQKGVVLSKMKKTEDAIKSFNQSIAINDSFDLAHVALAGALTIQKDYEGALKNYEKALSITTNDNLKTGIKEGIGTTYLLLGNNSMKEKKYDKAIDYFKKASEGNSDQAYLGLAKAYIEKRQYDNALSTLDKVEQNKKTVTDGAIAYYRGVVNLEKGDKAKAVDNFKLAAKDPVYKKASESQIARLNAEKEQSKKK
ncbi:MAG: tetratricopeptide repeat protein [Ignavibacteriales bacterium]